MSKKILLLEDDISLGETIEDLLIEQDYTVDYITTGNEAIDITFENKYDLYIFDINVPDIDGFDIFKSLRDADDFTPTIFISAMTDISTVLKCLKAGADDFIRKPFYPEELMAKVNLKLLKDSKKISLDSLEYYPSEKKIIKDKEDIYLGQVQLNIFELFINNKNRVITKDELYDCMERPSGNALRFHINKLKNITNLNIKNIRGSGYILE